MVGAFNHLQRGVRIERSCFFRRTDRHENVSRALENEDVARVGADVGVGVIVLERRDELRLEEVLHSGNHSGEAVDEFGDVEGGIEENESCHLLGAALGGEGCRHASEAGTEEEDAGGIDVVAGSNLLQDSFEVSSLREEGHVVCGAVALGFVTAAAEVKAIGGKPIFRNLTGVAPHGEVSERVTVCEDDGGQGVGVAFGAVEFAVDAQSVATAPNLRAVEFRDRFSRVVVGRKHGFIVVTAAGEHHAAKEQQSEGKEKAFHERLV